MQPSTEEEIALLHEACAIAERDVLDSLNVACQAGEKWQVTACAYMARYLLSDPSLSASLAAQAEGQLVRALATSVTSRDALERAQRSIRDVVVLRVQLITPLESRAAFMEQLQEAYGGDIPENGLAKLMHAHLEW